MRRHITTDDLLRFQLVSDPQIAPDGKSILFGKKHIGEKFMETSNLWLVNTKKGEPRQFSSGGKDGQGKWSGDGKRIAFTSGRDKPKSQIYIMETTGGEARPLTNFPEGSIGEFKWSPDGKNIAAAFRDQEPDSTEDAKKKREENGLSSPPKVIDNIWYRLDGDGYFNNQRFHLYLIDVETGKHRKIFDKAPFGIVGFDWSPDSREIVFASNLDKQAYFKPWKCRIYRLQVNNLKYQLCPGINDGLWSNVVWAPDGKKLVFTGQAGRADIWTPMNQHLFLYDIKSAKVTDLIGSEDYCLESAIISDVRDVAWSGPVIWSPDSTAIYFEIRRHGASNIARISLAEKKIEFMTNGPDQYSLGGISADGKRIAFRRSTAVSLDEIFVGEIHGKSLSEASLTAFNETLFKEMNLSEPEPSWVRSRDGTQIHTWIMKPPDFKQGKKYPAVLEIHGGPQTQYGSGFFHEFQLLAAQGYVVFFSNPRGSKGYGEKHCTVISGDWGNKDWEDIQAVTEFMTKQSFVDSKRMGIMGGSYGGYMTNWAIGHTDVFAAAITDRCVSNLVSMAGSSDFPVVPDTLWKGNAWSRPEELWNQSPLKYFGNVKTPTLVIHSEGDLRCNIEQAEQVFSALKMLGIPTRLVRYPTSTSHGMSRCGPSDLRIHRLNQILDWFKKYFKKSS